MKKLLSILLLTVAFTVTANAQTKEETIDWIRSKIAKGAFADGKNTITTDNYYIILKSDASRAGDYEHMECTATAKIPFSKIVRIDPNFFNGLYHGSAFTIYTADKDISITYENCSDNSSTSTSYFRLSIVYSLEENFTDRMVKAFNKLIGFNKANMPREVF